ncbi:hypothetical protein D0466_09720 [Peribacillus glennii]|uniref:Uncharacterized protein n=1 Tax=Peribacillus glennii TaxID=2303991 RepID=A0A372LCR9_9BACI|nr:hypothetical protein D0466_09720 [Peribacillus glennii]
MYASCINRNPVQKRGNTRKTIKKWITIVFQATRNLVIGKSYSCYSHFSPFLYIISKEKQSAFVKAEECQKHGALKDKTQVNSSCCGPRCQTETPTACSPFLCGQHFGVGIISGLLIIQLITGQDPAGKA